MLFLIISFMCCRHERPPMFSCCWRCLHGGGSSILSSTMRPCHVRLWAKLGRSRLATSVARDSVTVNVVAVIAGAGNVVSVSSSVWIGSTSMAEDTRKTRCVKGARLWYKGGTRHNFGA